MKKFLDLSYYKRNNTKIPLIYFPIRERKNELSNKLFFSDVIRFCDSEIAKTIYEYFYPDKDWVLLENLIKKHGFFFEKFFIDIKKQEIFKNHINLTDFQNLKEKYIESKQFYFNNYTDKNFVNDLTSDYLKTLFYNFNNEFHYSQLQSWHENIQLKNCKICGNEFNFKLFPDWLYYGSYGHKDICYECPISESIAKGELTLLVKKLVDKCGFIPNANFHPINTNFSRRISAENWSEICSIIFAMGINGFTLPTAQVVKENFGSWLKALVESKVLEEGVLKTARGFRCIANSGNECNSLDEQYIDNWFFERGIKMTKEPKYPKHEKYNPKGLRRADWFVNDCYIEYFGLKGEENYDKKTIEKFELAKELNLKLIPIFPDDLTKLEQIKEKIKNYS